MAVDALMGDVHPFAVAVEQFPEFVRGAERLGVRIIRGLRQRRHVVVPVWGPQSVEVILRVALKIVNDVY
ncbi:hypothetical protein G6F51_014781 [Rhizopus arrhizus]|uniref:Uncharacterized protein n=1 Tax=Rhizopus oryzae TaxID=64495 RepID=A0A9P7BY70_RHIOR|nr:hypothetical protein G6F51_014781 [Rhizopus arrhizus]